MTLLLDRRRFLGLGAGLAAAPLLPAGVALAQTRDKPTVVLIFLRGGYNCVFSSADACVPGGLFGASESSVLDLGGGLVVDRSSLGSLPTSVRDHMCTVGAAHGYPDHINGVRIWWNDDDRSSYPLRLTRALGGDAPLRCVAFGEVPGQHLPLDGISISVVPDLSGALIAAGADTAQGSPNRATLARCVEAATTYSRRAIQRSPNQLGTYHAALHTVRGMLTAPARSIDWPEIASAYGLSPESGSIASFTQQLAGAEVMVRAGTDVVLVTDSGRGVLEGADWDSHGDISGAEARAMMADRLASLSVFLQRTLALPGRNVVTAIYSEFARTANSEHAGGLSATVFGKRLKNASTGRAFFTQNGAYKLPVGSPGVDGFFALVAEAAGVDEGPFGVNPHRAVLR